MFFKGFKFGMILQLAVGPVCLYIIQLSCTEGLLSALFGVLAAFFADCIFVSLAVVGVARFIENDKAKKYMGICGSIALLAFGAIMVLASFGIQLIPEVKVSAHMGYTSSFAKVFCLTLSSPLSILFWTSVFLTKTREENLSSGELYMFASGSVFATLVFLSIVSIVVAAAGGYMERFLPHQIFVRLLDGLIGLFIIYFAVKRFKINIRIEKQQ